MNLPKLPKLFKGIGWSWLGVIGRGGLSFLLMPFFLAQIGTIGYGSFLLFNLYSHSGILLLLDFAQPLINTSFLSEKIRTKDSEGAISIIGFGLLFLAMTILLCLVVAISLFFYTTNRELKVKFGHLDLSYVIIFGFISSVIGFTLNSLFSFLMALKKTNFVKKIEALSSVFQLGLFAVSILYFQKSYFLVYISLYILFQIVSLLISGAEFFNSEDIRQLDFKKMRPWAVFQETLSLRKTGIVGRLNGVAFSQSDSFIVSILLSPEYLAILDIATKLLGIGKLFLGKINEFTLPYFANLPTETVMETRRHYGGRFLLLQISLSFMGGALIFAFADPFLQVWVGEKGNNMNLVSMMRLSAVALVIVPFSYFSSSFLFSNRFKLTEVRWVIFLVSVFEVLLVILLIPYFGLISVLWATILQLLVMGILMTYLIGFTKAELKIIFKEYSLISLSLLAATCISYLIAFNFPEGSVNTLIIGALSFVILLLVIFYLLLKKSSFFQGTVISFKEFSRRDY